ARPPRKNYNQLSSNEKLDNRHQDDVHIEETVAVESDASSTDLDERDTRGVCPPCAHDRYNNNIRRHAHDDFSDDSDYESFIQSLLYLYRILKQNYGYSFSFLYGPWAHLKSMFSKERALTTSLYMITLTATLYCALHLQSTPWTIICAVLQVIALFWMMMGSIPGGSTGARFFGSMFKSSVSNTLPI
ncbi:Protein transport protein sft2, partial [Operophtera brumata]